MRLDAERALHHVSPLAAGVRGIAALVVIVALTVGFASAPMALQAGGHDRVTEIAQDAEPQQQVLPENPGRKTDSSFPWPFVILGLGALAIGASFAFRPLRSVRKH